MSLGFLTESALLPSKAKQIRVDSKSLLDLKAVVFQKEQERDERRRRLRDEASGDNDEPRSTRRKRAGDAADGDGDALGKSVYARLKAQKRRRGSGGNGGDKGANRGVDERRRRDDEQRALDVDNSDDDAALQKMSREMLARKAQLYDQMMSNNGAVSAEAAKECLVDFGAKRRTGEWHASVAESGSTKDSDRETVEITDEFGRTRVVEKGSADYVEFVQREGAAQQAPESLFFEDKRRDESEAAGGGGSFVVSQWEKTLTGTEKQYLEQVHAGVERAKQMSSTVMTDKQRRKQLRLEKLKQQQQQQQQPPPATVQAAVDPQQDQQAAVQATAFLSSFM